MMLRKYLKEPPIPEDLNYWEIVNYLKECQNASLRYYSIVMGIGVIGLLAFLILTLILIGRHNWDLTILFNIKTLPGCIVPFITMGFAHLEMEAKKKELYKQLMEVMLEHSQYEDRKLIADDYKKWTWEEFQNRFKPEKS